MEEKAEGSNKEREKRALDYNLVEIDQPSFDGSTCIGTGGIVVFSDMRRLLVTAANVVLETNGADKGLLVNTMYPREDIPRRPTFNKINDDFKGVGYIELLPGEGIPVAERMDVSKPLLIKGAMNYKIYSIVVLVNRVEDKGERKIYRPEDGEIALNGKQAIHYTCAVKVDAFLFSSLESIYSYGLLLLQ